jgi:hypothetical protein
MGIEVGVTRSALLSLSRVSVFKNETDEEEQARST